MAYDLNIGISLGAAHAGLTLRAQLVDTAGANVGGEISSGFVAVGQGHYSLLASIPDGHRGGIKFYKDGETDVLAFAALNPEEAEWSIAAQAKLDAVKLKTDLITAGGITISNPVAALGDITLTADRDYASGGYVLQWTISGYTGPTLAAAGELRAMPIESYNVGSVETTIQVASTITDNLGTLTITVSISPDDTDADEASPPSTKWSHHYELVGFRSDNAKVVSLGHGSLYLRRPLAAKSA